MKIFIAHHLLELIMVTEFSHRCEKLSKQVLCKRPLKILWGECLSNNQTGGDRVAIFVRLNNFHCFGVDGVCIIFTCSTSSSTFLDSSEFCGFFDVIRLCSNSYSLFSTGIVLAQDLSISCSLTFSSVTSFYNMDWFQPQYIMVFSSFYSWRY